jgi:hypothetical protein
MVFSSCGPVRMALNSFSVYVERQRGKESVLGTVWLLVCVAAWSALSNAQRLWLVCVAAWVCALLLACARRWCATTACGYRRATLSHTCMLSASQLDVCPARLRAVAGGCSMRAPLCWMLHSEIVPGTCEMFDCIQGVQR